MEAKKAERIVGFIGSQSRLKVSEDLRRWSAIGELAQPVALRTNQVKRRTVRHRIAIGGSGVVLSREMIENNLWNYDYEGGTNVVDVYVGYLRKKMDAGFDKKLIHTVWGTGWVLRED